MQTLVVLLSILLGCHAVSAADHIGETVVITAKPRFEQRGQFVHLIISDANESFDIGWGIAPDTQFIPVSLDTNRVYVFTVGEKPYHNLAISELRKVQSEGQTLYDIEVCQVHKTKMERKEVRITYGLILSNPDEPSRDTERRLFPHRREHLIGGCIVSPEDPKTEKVYVCGDCKKAYEKWKAESKKTK